MPFHFAYFAFVVVLSHVIVYEMKIDIATDNTAAIIVWKALNRLHPEFNNLVKVVAPGTAEQTEVKLLVNGVEVPLSETLEDVYAELLIHNENRMDEKVFEQISQLKLEPFQKVLNEFKQQLECAAIDALAKAKKLAAQKS